MKKHFLGILIFVLVLLVCGVGFYIYTNNFKAKPLYETNTQFVINEDTENLILKINDAHDSYIYSGETRLTTLSLIISKLDSFEKDLNSYLVLSNINTSSTKKLSKSYENLTKHRKALITNCEEYITRMEGDKNADGPAIQNLYNDLFNKTLKYVKEYNKCFESTSKFVFSKVYKADTLKTEVYSLYSKALQDVIDNVANNRFGDLSLINRLNKGVTLSNIPTSLNTTKLLNYNLNINSSIEGGEFSTIAQNFKTNFKNSDMQILVENFNSYYRLNFNNCDSNEKLAVFYLSQLLNLEV